MNFDIWILGAKIQIFSEKIELFGESDIFEIFQFSRGRTKARE